MAANQEPTQLTTLAKRARGALALARQEKDAEASLQHLANVGELTRYIAGNREMVAMFKRAANIPGGFVADQMKDEDIPGFIAQALIAGARFTGDEIYIPYGSKSIFLRKPYYERMTRLFDLDVTVEPIKGSVTRAEDFNRCTVRCRVKVRIEGDSAFELEENFSISSYKDKLSGTDFGKVQREAYKRALQEAAQRRPATAQELGDASVVGSIDEDDASASSPERKAPGFAK